jgi:hypothetical protein
MEGLAWLAELTLAIVPSTACTAGLTLSLGVKNFAAATLFGPTGFDIDMLCLMASEIFPLRPSASSSRRYSQAHRMIQMFRTRDL